MSRKGLTRVLIDNGTPKKRARLEAELAAAGCRRGNLRLIVVTHGDYDHAATPPTCATATAPT